MIPIIFVDWRKFVVPVVVALLLLSGACRENSAKDLTRSNDTAAADTLAAKANQAFNAGDYTLALNYFQQHMKMMQEKGDSLLYYDAKLDIACVYDRSKLSELSIKTGEEVLRAYLRLQDTTRIGKAYSTLSAFYGGAGKLDQCIELAKTGLYFTRFNHDPLLLSQAYNQLAFTYFDLRQWQPALLHFDTAMTYMKQAGQLEYIPTLQLNIGDCYAQLRNMQQARTYLDAAAASADSLGQLHIKALALWHLSTVSQKNGQVDDALGYLKKSMKLKDSLLSIEKAQALIELETKYQTREKEQEIRLLKSKEFTYQLLIICATLAMAVLGLSVNIQRSKLRNTRNILEQNQKELNDYANMLLQKNTYIKSLEEQSVLTEKEPLASPSSEFTDDDQSRDFFYNNRILTEPDWSAFKFRFEKVFPGLLFRLRETYSGLSGAEERLFLLIKLNFNTQEIADTLGITTNAVKKGRQRLRRRMELQPEDDLEKHVHTF